MSTLPIDTERLTAVYSGQIEPVVDWVTDPATGKRAPGEQARDEQSGHPLWTIHILVAEGDRPLLAAVRVPAAEAPSVTAFTPARFERLTATARVNRQTGLLALYWSASGIADARQQQPRRQGQGQGEQPAAA